MDVDVVVSRDLLGFNCVGESVFRWHVWLVNRANHNNQLLVWSSSQEFSGVDYKAEAWEEADRFASFFDCAIRDGGEED